LCVNDSFRSPIADLIPNPDKRVYATPHTKYCPESHTRIDTKSHIHPDLHKKPYTCTQNRRISHLARNACIRQDTPGYCRWRREECRRLVSRSGSNPNWLHALKIDAFRAKCVHETGHTRILPLETTGMPTASFTERIQSQLASHLPVRLPPPLSRVRPCTVRH